MTNEAKKNLNEQELSQAAGGARFEYVMNDAGEQIKKLIEDSKVGGKGMVNPFYDPEDKDILKQK